MLRACGSQSIHPHRKQKDSRVFMSDHWNSLANLLGTPSLAPQKPKTDPAAPLAAEPAATSDQPVVPEPAAVEKAKPAEKSKLRSSWDAVANFFGMASQDSEAASVEPEAAPAPPTPRSQPKTDAGRARAANPSTPPAPVSKKKPSLWGGEESTTPEPAPEDRPIHASRSEESDDREPLRSRRDTPREPKRRSEPPAKEDTASAPDRRSHRRPPRRAQESTEEVRSGSNSERAPSRRTPTRESKPDRTHASRAPSPPSETRTPAEPRSSSRPSGFGAGIAPPNDRIEDDRDLFDEAPVDVEIFDDEAPSKTRDDQDASSEESRGEGSGEGRPRRRRRRGGRGRTREQADNLETERSSDARDEREPSDDAEDSAEEDARLTRHSKIPSWTETISVLVESNMLNHQRSQGSQRGTPRGRGRR